jgi:hypothetical protein
MSGILINGWFCVLESLTAKKLKKEKKHELGVL